MSFVRTHQKELIAAVVGACLAGVFSMAAGLYSLTKSFEYSQNKEQLTSLRADIEFLTRVRNEIDTNTQTLLSSNYRVSAKFGEPIDTFRLMVKLDTLKKINASEDDLRSFKTLMGGRVVPIIEIASPRERLIVESWGSRIPEAGDIRFDLLAEINDYYRRVRRINLSIQELRDFVPGQPLSEGFVPQLQKDMEHHNTQVEDLRKLDVVKLKNSITSEIQVLSERRKKLSATFSTAG